MRRLTSILAGLVLVAGPGCAPGPSTPQAAIPAEHAGPPPPDVGVLIVRAGPALASWLGPDAMGVAVLEGEE